MIDDPDYYITGLELAAANLEKDFLEIIRLVGYSGADIRIEGSPYLENGEYGKSYIKNAERVIECDLVKLEGANASLEEPSKRWCSKWLLAHELGHHVHGHLQTVELTPRAEELQCDRYSGFVLGLMGAKLDEADYFLRNFTPDQPGNPEYPALSERLEYLEKGWQDAFNMIETLQNNRSSL